MSLSRRRTGSRTPEGHELIIGAVRPLSAASGTAAAPARGLRTLPPPRPAYIQSVRIPITAWARPQVDSLRRARVPSLRRNVTVWRLTAESETYEEQS